MQQNNKRQIVSLTPLIDIVFILLVFFMLASSFVDWQYLQVNTSASVPVQSNEDNFSLVYLDIDKSYRLNDKPLSLQDISKQIKNELRQDLNHIVLIQPHAELELQTMVSAMETLKQETGAELSITRGIKTAGQ